MDEGSLPGAFRSLPADYGPAPLLVFNDEHEGEAGAHYACARGSRAGGIRWGLPASAARPDDRVPLGAMVRADAARCKGMPAAGAGALPLRRELLPERVRR